MVGQTQNVENGDDGGVENQYQYVWLIRYGKTYPGLIENVGNYDSDLHHPDGIEHAQAIANHILSSAATANNGENDSSSTGMIPKHVFSDPFVRCMRTADIIVSTLNDKFYDNDNVNKLKLKIEEGMTEWQVPSLLVDKDGNRTYPKNVSELAKMFDTVDEAYQSLNPQGPDRKGEEEEEEERNDNTENGGFDGDENHPPRFPESEEQLHRRCKTTIRRIMKHVDNNESIAIVGHAPCCQSAALALEGSSSPADATSLGPWSLGGITLFQRPINGGGEGKWTLKSYSDTSHMPSEYKDGKLGQWSLPSFVRE